MAPPIPGLRKPVQVRHRTVGDVVVGIGAIILLTALTIGVPVALVAVVGLPIPHTMPKLNALTSQLDVTAILRILSPCVVGHVQGGVRLRGGVGDAADAVDPSRVQTGDSQRSRTPASQPTP